MLVAESFLATGPAARTSGDRYQIVVNSMATCWHSIPMASVRCTTVPRSRQETGAALVVRRVWVLMVRGPNGEVLDIGRKTRSDSAVRSGGHCAPGTDLSLARMR